MMVLKATLVASTVAALVAGSAAAQPDTLVGTDITGAVWLRRPSAQDVVRVYPRAAALSGQGGVAKIRCGVTAAGRMKDCVLVEERPASAAFGAAALKLSPLFVMSPTTAAGASVEGGFVTIPMTFEMRSR